MTSFSAWKQGAVYYVTCFVLGAGCWYLGMPVIAGLFLVGGACCLFFFRDPPRRIPGGPNEVVCPADGTVVSIEDLDETPHYEGPCTRVSIFLSMLDVHVNRSPVEGAICKIRYQPGEFKNAMKAETSECNESNALWLDTPHGPMTVRQIAGAIARRIVCVREVGDILAKGEKFGMIKFGSRTELYLPREAEIHVEMKQKVRAGATVVARFP